MVYIIPITDPGFKIYLFLTMPIMPLNKTNYSHADFYDAHLLKK